MRRIHCGYIKSDSHDVSRRKEHADPQAGELRRQDGNRFEFYSYSLASPQFPQLYRGQVKGFKKPPLVEIRIGECAIKLGFNDCG